MKVKRVEHVAMAVNDLDEFVGILRDKLGLTLEYSEVFPQYQTKMAMFPVGETYLEVIQGTAPASEPARWIAEKGQGLYHICLEVDDIEGALAELKAKGMSLLDETPREGHGNTRIAFIDPRSTSGVLIELVETPAEYGDGHESGGADGSGTSHRAGAGGQE